ncbi:translocator protein [Agrilus planipennis]|uniref:Translocator protein n=1 Tax=Agrilus planipennis TaxID=224129 RepID=A0A1W4WB43_AGRPL|nr:translocator protein [Agrilus planipennis]
MVVNWPAAGAVLLPHIGGFAGAIATRSNVETWYKGLQKPCFTPPTWSFGCVWSGIYSGIGYASYMVWRDGGGFEGEARLPLAVYATNLALNWAWTPIFFGAKKTQLALYEINLITATAVATGVLFYKINPIAGYLFIPYIAWLGLATALNYKIWKDNPEETDDKIVEIKDK